MLELHIQEDCFNLLWFLGNRSRDGSSFWILGLCSSKNYSACPSFALVSIHPTHQGNNAVMDFEHSLIALLLLLSDSQPN